MPKKEAEKRIAPELLRDLERYLLLHYAPAFRCAAGAPPRCPTGSEIIACDYLPSMSESALHSARPPVPQLPLGDSFAVALMKLIDAKGMDDVECYKKADVSKQTWHKIQNDRDYRPSKITVLSFAVALRLTLEETERLLDTAGFSLSKSRRFDVIVRYFLENAIYDVFTINEALLYYDEAFLGTRSIAD